MVTTSEMYDLAKQLKKRINNRNKENATKLVISISGEDIVIEDATNGNRIEIKGGTGEV